MAKTVLVPIADGTEEIEAVCIIDTLRRAQADVTVASASQKLSICASRGVNITADKMICDCADKEYDLIALPGGMPGAANLRNSEELAGILKMHQSKGRLYGAICASPAVVLQYHGLIGDRKATCYPSFAKELRNYSDMPVVADGNCVTAQGPAMAMEFALKLVELLFDKSKSHEVAKAMLVRV